MNDADNLQSRKRQWREHFSRSFQGPVDIELGSRAICDRVTKMAEYSATKAISSFVSLPAEVQTIPLIRSAWAEGKEVAVPCCIDGRLRLFQLKSMRELTPPSLGIPDPHKAFRSCRDRWVDASRVDLFVVPGVAP